MNENITFLQLCWWAVMNWLPDIRLIGKLMRFLNEFERLNVGYLDMIFLHFPNSDQRKT